MQLNMSKERFATYLRNFVFGVEDSLVSTVGLVSGVAIAGASKSAIFLTGMVLIFVEAFSMGVGSFLSEQSSEGYMKQGEPALKLSVSAAVIMFVSYFISGFIPLAPYIALEEPRTAFGWSIAASLAALLILGMCGARLSKLPMWRGGLKMMLVGGFAIALGVLVGAVLNSFGFSVV